MLGDKVWLTVGASVHPKTVGWALCRPVKYFQTKIGFSLWTWLCAKGHRHVETGKGQTQTVDTKLKCKCPCNCL